MICLRDSVNTKYTLLFIQKTAPLEMKFSDSRAYASFFLKCFREAQKTRFAVSRNSRHGAQKNCVEGIKKVKLEHQHQQFYEIKSRSCSSFTLTSKPSTHYPIIITAATSTVFHFQNINTFPSSFQDDLGNIYFCSNWVNGDRDEYLKYEAI